MKKLQLIPVVAFNLILQERTIKHVNSGNCLTRATPEDPSTPLLRPCLPFSESQQVRMITIIIDVGLPLLFLGNKHIHFVFKEGKDLDFINIL